MDCEFSSGGVGERCARCGYALKRASKVPPVRNCSGGPGLGDRVANLLTAVGITEARWLALKGVVIENPTCGCQKRKEKLNRWGRWLAKWK